MTRHRPIPEAAQRSVREMTRLQAAATKSAAPSGTARARLQEAGAVAVHEPLITTSLLARKLGVSSRAGLDLVARLVEAEVLREMRDGPRGANSPCECEQSAVS